MLKIRLQGTTRDIKWFLKILKKDNRFILNEPSDPMAIKGSNKYKRVYSEIFRDLDDLRAFKSRNTNTESKDPKIERIYVGSGTVFGYQKKKK